MTLTEVLDILEAEFGEARSELDYRNEFELLIAVLLSAQTTDIAVNKVTKDLFKAYPDPKSLAQASPQEIEPYLKTIGLYRNKSKYVVACARKIVEEFDGKVPSTRKELESLPGVGRKTANVVLSEGFGIPAIAVDTHVARVAKRLGIAKNNDSVLQIEKKLQNKIPKERWHKAHHLLLLFGRYYSTASNQEDPYVILERLKEKHTL